MELEPARWRDERTVQAWQCDPLALAPETYDAEPRRAREKSKNARYADDDERRRARRRTSASAVRNATSRTFSNTAFPARNAATSRTAISLASPMGNPKIPVLMAGNAMELAP